MWKKTHELTERPIDRLTRTTRLLDASGACVGRRCIINILFLILPRCMVCRRGLAMRILSVRPFVCLSVKRVDCDKTEERSVQKT